MAPVASDAAALPPLEDLVARASKRTRLLFAADAHIGTSSLASLATDPSVHDTTKAHLGYKISSEYKDAKQLPAAILAQQAAAGPARPDSSPCTPSASAAAPNRSNKRPNPSLLGALIDDMDGTADAHGDKAAVAAAAGSAAGSAATAGPQTSQALTIRAAAAQVNGGGGRVSAGGMGGGGNWGLLSQALVLKKEQQSRQAKPAHHANWKLSRVISGHLGWVRSVAVEPGNKWFATGAGDRMIKIWDLASGELKLSLTGHISTVRGIAISSRHPYLFSCGEDRQVKCWDLEQNKVIRSYAGHLTGVYSIALHPTLDVLVTGSRDSSARVWDMRTKAQIHTLVGHKSTVASVVCQDSEPQVITGSMDATVRLWDLAAGKSITTLTHHKKSVRALAVHPTEYTFASGSAGGRNIKTWRCPDATLVNNMTHDTIVNTLSVNSDGVLFSGGDDGSLKFFDYATGVPFQSAEDIPQPGSLDAEAGVFCSAFDQTGTRLITGGADKTIKVYKEV